MLDNDNEAVPFSTVRDPLVAAAEEGTEDTLPVFALENTLTRNFTDEDDFNGLCEFLASKHREQVEELESKLESQIGLLEASLEQKNHQFMKKLVKAESEIQAVSLRNFTVQIDKKLFKTLVIPRIHLSQWDTSAHYLTLRAALDPWRKGFFESKTGRVDIPQDVGNSMVNMTSMRALVLNYLTMHEAEITKAKQQLKRRIPRENADNPLMLPFLEVAMKAPFSRRIHFDSHFTWLGDTIKSSIQDSNAISDVCSRQWEGKGVRSAMIHAVNDMFREMPGYQELHVIITQTFELWARKGLLNDSYYAVPNFTPFPTRKVSKTRRYITLTSGIQCPRKGLRHRPGWVYLYREDAVYKIGYSEKRFLQYLLGKPNKLKRIEEIARENGVDPSKKSKEFLFSEISKRAAENRRLEIPGVNVLGGRFSSDMITCHHAVKTECDVKCSVLPGRGENIVKLTNEIVDKVNLELPCTNNQPSVNFSLQPCPEDLFKIML